ncbi:uncharacterized protein Z520_09955 [Fonsecaea multimorphosa CBS 102226]|uniref:UBA domain-containing protein n=1 Tax=Fonsecaea multimorphosa CBS 102226 TaxID=1442371 RepID=A0A0D2GXE9_9EURO|nr:uncharacterized protein Z520_09955 [Fonsecaea multimorphosa CBS 102226]KIX94245.1 hypothetical protein Z520_09955 [Fonsecaea multimorphosa CBS 102226]
MAGVQPTRDHISQVCAITQVDEGSARVLLKKSNNDVNGAINAFFEDPVRSVIEEPAASNDWQYQDNIPFQDDSSMGGVAALSRPPSRADNSMMDLSSEHAAASASNVKSLKEQEELNDPDLQRAMAESLGQSLPAQEDGVTGTGAHFGPANREYYDPSSWALTTYSTSREIIEHPPPSKRRRIAGEPAFLRGSKETGYLGSLLTIYHNIPLARQALLMPALKVHAYAHDNSWWSGATDENTKALSTDNTLRIDRQECNLLTEVQCLMAFLDRTTRAYGSVDALADLQAVRNRNDATPFHRFLEAWTSAAMKQAPQEQVTQVFSSVATKAGGPGDTEVVEKTLNCIDPFINHFPGETLTDLLDITIWNDEHGNGNIDDVWISHCAEIFTIRVHDPNSTTRSSDLQLDPVWYPDRYMYECREQMQQIRKELQSIRREIDQYTHIQRRCQIYKSSDNRLLDVAEVLNSAVKASTTVLGKKSVSNGFLDSQASGADDTVTQADVDELGSALQSVLQKIRQKLDSLDQRKNELRLRSRQITMRLTKPTPETPDVPNRKYTLQGVATKPGVTYFRRHTKIDSLIDHDILDQDSQSGDWWRTAWLQDEAQPAVFHPPLVGPVTRAQAEATKQSETTPYSVTRVQEAEVLEAVRKEYNSVLLVYANENAMNFQGGELSISLRHFVDRDNQAYAEELQQEEGPLPSASADHEAETEFEDVPLIDPTASSGSVRELTPMSTSSPDHEEDTQPSHKITTQEDSAAHFLEQPPSYEETVGRQEMLEKKGNKIGLYAEQMLQKYGGDAVQEKGENETSGGFLEVEDANAV